MINNSGIRPIEYKVLIKQDEVEETTNGGIVIAKETARKEQWAETRATIIAVGGNAFEDFKDEVLPKPGDKIIYMQYSGKTNKGKDGVDYQLINDKEVLAVLEA